MSVLLQIQPRWLKILLPGFRFNLAFSRRRVYLEKYMTIGWMLSFAQHRKSHVTYSQQSIRTDWGRTCYDRLEWTVSKEAHSHPPLPNDISPHEKFSQ